VYLVSAAEDERPSAGFPSVRIDGAPAPADRLVEASVAEAVLPCGRGDDGPAGTVCFDFPSHMPVHMTHPELPCIGFVDTSTT